MNITIGNPWAVSEKGGRLNNEEFYLSIPETVKFQSKLIFGNVMVSGGLKKGRLQVHWLASLFQTFFLNFS